MCSEPRKRPLRKINLDLELTFAFENSSYELQNYLDVETGEVVLVTAETRRHLEEIYEELDGAGDTEATHFAEAIQKRDLPDWQKEALVEADRVETGFGTRYSRVPVIDSHEACADMEEFIEIVRDERVQERLGNAIRGRGTFRRFKNVLLDYPRDRERWFQFEDGQMRQRVLDWLEEEGIEPN